MKKKAIIFSISGCIIVLLIGIIILYRLATINTSDGNIFLSPQKAISNWGLKSDKILYEVAEDDFYVALDNNLNIKSVRKDFVFWVRCEFESVSYNGSTEDNIKLTKVDDILYIYGGTTIENVASVKIVDILLNEKPMDFYSSYIENDLLFFCLKVSTTDLPLGSYSLCFVDNENNILSSLESKRNLERDELINKALSLQNKKATPQENLDLSDVPTFTQNVGEKYYLQKSDKEYVMQKNSEWRKFFFFEDFVLVQDRKRIFTFPKEPENVSSSNFYDNTYILEYTDEMIKLKQEVLQSADG